MAWLIRDSWGDLYVCNIKPIRDAKLRIWRFPDIKHKPFELGYGIELPSDADEKLIGKHLTWDDEPVEI